MNGNNLKLAIQKKGRLTDKTINLLRSSGIDIDNYSDRLTVSARNFDLDILFLRDDDIPEYVQDGVADIGVVGENVLLEKQSDVKLIKRLGYSRCRLMIAAPNEIQFFSLEQLNGKKIATSYPNILRKYLENNNVSSKVIDISGSVEIAPALGIADYICDIVSTGNTLKLHKLKEVSKVIDSEALLISRKNIENDNQKNELLNKLIQRIESSLTAKSSKYLMMNIPADSLEKIKKIVPAIKSPTVLPLADESMLAVHAVIPKDLFWSIIDDLKSVGASGILLFPIENLIP